MKIHGPAYGLAVKTIALNESPACHHHSWCPASTVCLVAKPAPLSCPAKGRESL